MKKVIGMLCMILFLTGCGQAQKASEMPTPQSDAAQAEGQAHVPEDYLQSNIGFADLVETPEGYYYAAKVRPMRYGADVPPMLFQLCFCPKGESTFCVLCGKPNCLHLDQDCNACADRVFTYFNGAIYTVSHDSGLRLDKMNLDGTDHQSVAVVVDLTTSCTLDYHFHHGKLFVASLPDQTAPLELQESHLFALDLTDYSRKELATDYFQTGEIFCIAKLYRDKLYFYGCQKDSSYDMNAVQLVEVDVNTGASRVLM